MKKSNYKAINFDLDTKAMKELGVYPNGYKDIRKTMKKLGFDHRQGSGYVSKNEMNEDEVIEKITDLSRLNSWLSECVKKLDVTNIGVQYDLTTVVQRAGTSSRGKELKKKETKEDAIAQQYKQSPSYQSNVEKFGKKTADRMLSESLKNMYTQEKKGRWSSPKKQTKAPQDKAEKNNSGKGK